MNRTRLLPLAALPLLLALNPALPHGLFAGRQPGAQPGPEAEARSRLAPAQFLAQEAPSDAAHLFPASTLVFMEAPGLPALLDTGLDHPLVARLLASPLGVALLADAKVTPRAGLAFADALLGQPLLPALASATQDGLALGVLPDKAPDGKAQWLLAALGDDELVTEELLGRALSLAGAKHDVDLLDPTEHHAGADIWLLGDALALARRDALFLASNDARALRAALETSATEHGLAGREAFRADRAARLEDHAQADTLLWAWFDRERTEELLTTFGDPQGFAKLAAPNREPGSQYVLGPGLSALGTGERLVASLALEDDALALRFVAHGAHEATSVTPVHEELGARSASTALLPGSILRESGAAAVVYRDLAGLWSHRQDLFPAERGPALVRGMSQLGLFFGGLDLPEEVLPAISPWLRLVAAPVAFTAGAEPEQPLPALAVLVELSEPELGLRLTAAFQGLIGVLGVESAQQGRAPLVLHVKSLAGAADGPSLELNYASFPIPREGDGVDLRYNLEPACVAVGSTFVLGTHRELVERIARDFAAGDTLPVSALPGSGPVSMTGTGTEHSHERLSLPGALLSAALEPNREALVMQGVYEEGKRLEQSREDIDGLIALTEMLQLLSLDVAYAAPGELHAELRLTLAPESASAGQRGPSERRGASADAERKDAKTTGPL